MKTCKQWIDSLKHNPHQSVSEVDFYNAGAEEMRKSMRCETCEHWFKDSAKIYNEWHGYCNSQEDLDGRRTRDQFGCIHHKERGTE